MVLAPRESNVGLGMMEERSSFKILEICAVIALGAAYLSSFAFGTWDRIESHYPTLMLSGAAFLVTGVTQLFARRSMKQSVTDLLVILAGGYFFTRACYSPVEMYGKLDAALVVFAVCLWLARSLLSAEWVRKGWIISMVAVMLVNALAAHHQSYVDASWAPFIERSNQAQGRVSGVFSHPNYFANYGMLMVVVGVFVGALSDMNRFWRSLCLSLAVGNGAMVFWSFSRGGQVGLLSGLVIGTICVGVWVSGSPRKVRDRFAKWVFVSIPIIIAVCGFAVNQVKSVRGFDEAGYLKTNAREYLLDIAIDQIEETPVFGGGARSFEWESIRLWPQNMWQASGTLNYVHNEFVQSATDYGLIGFGILSVLLLGAMVWVVYYLVVDTGPLSSRAWTIAMVAGVGGFLTQCLFSFPAHIPANLWSVMILMGVGWPGSGSERGPVWSRVPAFCVCLAGGVFLLAVGAPEQKAFEHYLITNETHEVDYSQSETLLNAEIASTKEILEESVNFKRLAHLGNLAVIKYEQSSDAKEGEKWLRTAQVAFGEAVARYPGSPTFRLNHGLALTQLGQFGAGEGELKMAADVGIRREFWLDANWKYAEYCYYRGVMLWKDRRPEEAVEYFKEAQKYLEKSNRARRWKRWDAIEADLKAKLKFLEAAGFD